jgi:formylglycine-generating enzyme required for sulfatase activity
MHGNVWGWCSDYYDEDYYSNSPSVDPKGPPIGFHRSIRGGSWRNHWLDLRYFVRSRGRPGGRYNRIGFRIVRSQP